MEIALIKSYTEKPWRSPETYRLIENSLKERWDVKTIHTENLNELYYFFKRLNWKNCGSIFAFNIAEYLDEKKKEGFLPALLDEWNIPHLGSSAETIAVGLDKANTKALFIENQIPTPRYFIAHRGDSDIERKAKRIGYPLFVKPIGEGGHIGISEDSIVYDDESLIEAIIRVFDYQNQPALVEEYITGDEMREFSVGIIDSKPRLFTPVEIDYDMMDVQIPILSYEAAEKDLERIKFVEDGEILDEIIDLAERTFDAVSARDYGRVDLRMNHTGCYVLEINIMPGLGPHSFLPEAAKELYALEFNQLIHKLVEDSMRANCIL